MMKKILSIFLCGILLIGMTGCDNEKKADYDHKATIIDNNGTQVEMTAEELIAFFDSNEAEFYKLYSGAKITFESTVESVTTNTMVIVEDGKVADMQNKIVFTDGWCLVIGSENTNFDLASYEVGDVLQVTTSIVSAPWHTDFLREISNNERVIWLVGNDKVNSSEPQSDIQTTITKVK